MITYRIVQMKHVRHLHRQLVNLAVGYDRDEYGSRLMAMESMGMKMCLAVSDGRIVGSIGYMTPGGETGFTKSSELVEATVAKGVDPDKVQVRSLIFVAPHMQGHGIAHQLEVMANEDSRNMGFEYRAAFAYDNEKIFDWIHRHGNAIDLGIDDPYDSGYPCSLIPINTP